MNVYDYSDYRAIIKDRVRELKKTRPALSLRSVATKIPIQYTYLSKALNDEKTHLNEDHIFAIGNLLELVPEEVDYLLLCRSHDLSTDTARRKILFGKIEKLKKAKNLAIPMIEPTTGRLIQEMSYMFDPMCLVIHMALEIPQVKRQPELICSRLGMTLKQLKEALKKMAKNGFIEFEESPLRVLKVNQVKMHFGRDHALMRIHQNLLKTTINAQLMRVPEEQKHSFLATFTADERAFQEIKDEFQNFINRVEKIVSRSKNSNVYQLSFDIFPWM